MTQPKSRGKQADPQGASVFVREEVAHFASGTSIERAPEEVFLWWVLGIEHADSGGFYIPPGAGDALTEFSLRSEGARDLARYIIAHSILHNGLVPSELRKLASLMVMGELRKLARPGPKKKDGDRNLFIVFTLHDLEAEYGIRPLRNAYRSQKSAAPPSGCDMVSQEFKKHRGWADVTYDACATAWRHRKWAMTVMRKMEEPPAVHENVLGRLGQL